jgi:hypothetical protein
LRLIHPTFKEKKNSSQDRENKKAFDISHLVAVHVFGIEQIVYFITTAATNIENLQTIKSMCQYNANQSRRQK